MTDTPSPDKRIELKFVLDPVLSDAVKQWACEHLRVDQNCNGDLGDSHLQASPANGWQVDSVSGQANRRRRLKTTDAEILELKFHNRMPPLFKVLLRTFAIPATGFSKYRTAVESWNLDVAAPAFTAVSEYIASEESLTNA